MKSEEIKKLFVDYFKKNGHIELEEYSLIPLNDKSLLFTNSGMVQFKNIFLGIDESYYDKVVTIQTCIRLGGKHNDFHSIGESKHHNTSFKMLGNFSFKNTSQIETIELCWNFLIEVLNIDINRLYVTVHKNDVEVFNIWFYKIGLDEKKILFGNDETNFWSMDENGPCGYCTEIFYNLGDGVFDSKNLLEIWNIVFIQFNREGTSLNKLKNMYIDTGMGLERITSVVTHLYDNFKVDVYKSLCDIVLSKFDVLLNEFNEKHVRIIVDHLKTSILLLKSGLLPSNDGRGYILKKLIRRAILSKNELKVKRPLSYLICYYITIIDVEKKYTEHDFKFIEEMLDYEEIKFNKTLFLGISSLRKMILNGTVINGKVLFNLYDTYGLPLDFIKDILDEYKIEMDIIGFNIEMDKQIINSRNKDFSSGLNFDYLNVPKTKFVGYECFIAETKILGILIDNFLSKSIHENNNGILITEKTSFYSEKGGQVGDIGEIRNEFGKFLVSDTKDVNGIYLHFGKMAFGSMSLNDNVITSINIDNRNGCSNNHSATHLLHSALKKGLGEHIKQAGSLVCSDYLRFDFTHFAPLSKGDILFVEKYVNSCILSNLNVKTFVDFDKVSGDIIRTVSIGDDVSIELCGGTHVSNTAKIGLFKILKDVGIGNNLRRIEAVTGSKILEYVDTHNIILDVLSKKLKTTKDKLDVALDKIILKNKNFEKEVNSLYIKEIKTDINNCKDFLYFNHLKVISLFKDKKYLNFLKTVMLDCKHLVLLFFYSENNNLCLSIHISNDVNEVKAINIANYLSEYSFFKGGGKDKSASGVILNMDEVLNHVYLYFENNIKSEEKKC